MTHSHKWLVRLFAVSSALVLTGSGCSSTAPTPPSPTPTTPADTATTPTAVTTPVNACDVFTSAQIATAFSTTSSTRTGDGTPRPGDDNKMYSNCHWDLNDASHMVFELHTETYPTPQGAHDIVAFDLQDDHTNGGSRYDFTMESSFGSDAYFRQDQTSTMFSIVKGNTFYALYLKAGTTLEKTMAREKLKQLAGGMR